MPPRSIILTLFVWTTSALGLSSGARGEHWAYSAPQATTVPPIAGKVLPNSPVDCFIQARLEAIGLRPSSEADRLILVRRATLALTGLPPPPEEVQAFLADESPDSFERLVDRLLASPRYGERMATDWLDLARYADTHGYHSDSERTMWRWRDWVIDSLNAGMPYDQFTIEQLAGDLLPQPSLEQRIATGFHRNHMLNDENGAVPEEFLTEYIVDRVATTGTVWLGQTFACARCHDHKYDPLSQRDFYRLYAFFNGVAENGLGGRTGNSPPVIQAPTRLQQQALRQLDEKTALLERQLTERTKVSHSAFEEWQRSASAATDARHRPPQDAVVHLRLDDEKGDRAGNAAEGGAEGRVKGNANWLSGKFGGALLADGQTHVELSDVPNWDRNDAFSLSVWIFPTTNDSMSIIGRVDEVQGRRGFDFALARGKPALRLTHLSEVDEIEVVGMVPLKRSQWQHLVATYDGSGKAKGVAVYVNGQLQPGEIVRDTLRGHIQGDQPLTVGRGDSKSFFRGLIDEVQIFDRALSAAEAAVLAGNDPVRALLSVPAAERTESQQETLRRYYLESHDPTYRDVLAELATAKNDRRRIEQQVPTTMVMQELPAPRTTRVLNHGQFDQPGEAVTAGTPAYLPKMNQQPPSNRLALARWLVSPENPLTARVAVNRAWQTLFGEGLVRTPDDFGLRGEPPTHPRLLDWLAREYVDLGWDTKRLHRLLVTSATFRQRSAISPERLARDPENRLWARGPRFRLPAETIRDQALFAAGLLDVRLGGPSVKPYQPAELWRELAYDPNDYTAQVFVQSHGADLYRRSLYTFWKRSVPPPNLALFDAPDRETCTAARSRSSSPLQALVLMNDVAFLEASRRLAERVMRDTPADTAAGVDRLFWIVLARHATDRERELLTEQLKQNLMEFRATPKAATALLKAGESPIDRSLDKAELAAWTLAASTVLNLEETVTLR